MVDVLAGVLELPLGVLEDRRAAQLEAREGGGSCRDARREAIVALVEHGIAAVEQCVKQTLRRRWTHTARWHR